MAYWDFDTDTVQQDGENIPLVADYHLPSQLSTPYGIVYYTVSGGGIASYTFEDVHGIELLCPSNSTLYRTDTITLPNGDTVSLDSFRWLELGYKHKNLPDNLLRGMENLGYGFESRTMYLPEECEHIGSDFLSTRGLSGTYNPSFKSQIVLPQSLKSTASTPAIGDNFLSLQKNFNKSLHIPAISGAGVQIGNYFMYGCSAFNSPLTMDSSITSFGTHFLSAATAFNQPIAWTQQITSVGASFLENTSDFNQTVVFANGAVLGNNVLSNCRGLNSSVDISGVSSIGVYFMAYLRAFNSSSGKKPVIIVGNNPATIALQSVYSFCAYSNQQPAYTGGVKFYGDTASDWVARFPTRTTTPYRKTSEYRPYYGKVKYLDGNNEQQVAYLVTSAQYATTRNSTPYQISGLNLSCQDSYDSASPSEVTVAGNKITAFEFGELATSTPNFFLGLATLQEVLKVPSSITNYGQGFLSGVKLYYGVTFERPTIPPTVNHAFMHGVNWGSNSTVTPLTSIDIPEGISRVGSNFMNSLSSTWSTQSSSNILQINLPASLTDIGDSAFGQLSSDTAKYNVNFKEGLRRIGSYFGCTTVADSRSAECSFGKFPSTLATIGTDFLNYPGKVIGAIDLSDTAITTIPRNFMGGNVSPTGNRPEYTSILLPSGVTSVGDNCLYCYYSGIPPITLPSSITTYGNNFMANCVMNAGSHGLESDLVLNVPNATGNIVIGDNFLASTKGTYSGMSGSITLTIPQNVYSIGNNFCAGSSIKTPFTLPTWAQSWGSSFMEKCSLLKDTSSSVVFAITEDLSTNPSGMPAVANHTTEQTSLANYDNQYWTIQNTPIPISIPNQSALSAYQQLMNTAFPSYNASGSTTHQHYRRPFDFITP